MQIYVNDNDDTFPGMASQHSGFQTADRIYWRTNTAFPQVDKSPIVIALANREQQIIPLSDGH